MLTPGTSTADLAAEFEQLGRAIKTMGYAVDQLVDESRPPAPRITATERTARRSKAKRAKASRRRNR